MQKYVEDNPPPKRISKIEPPKKPILYIDCTLQELNRKLKTERQSKKDFEKEHLLDYESRFINEYNRHRIEYYQKMMAKYINIDCKINSIGNASQYEIKFVNRDINMIFCCELKPMLGDDYPSVLRKMKQQIKLTKADKVAEYLGNYRQSLAETSFKNMNEINKIVLSGKSECEKMVDKLFSFVLIIKEFSSEKTSVDQLREIFRQSNIKVLFMNEISNDKNTLDQA